MNERHATGRTWRIGELAALAGITVRTLHHYEQLGLITPAAREDGAHRAYDADAVEQLYRIRALRSLGFSLREIQSLPQDEVALATLLREHLARVTEEVERLIRLRDSLQQLAGPDAVITPGEIAETLSGMALLEQHAHQRVAAHRPGVDENKAAWDDLRDALCACLAAGAEPASDVVRPLALQAEKLIAAFSGGDAGILRAMARVRRSIPPQEFAGWDPPLFQYLERALAALKEEESHA
jgi:DNA-binding transcriptional MerR regulator